MNGFHTWHRWVEIFAEQSFIFTVGKGFPRSGWQLAMPKIHFNFTDFPLSGLDCPNNSFPDNLNLMQDT